MTVPETLEKNITTISIKYKYKTYIVIGKG